MTNFLGLDLGGTKLLACLTDSNGVVIASAVRKTGRATGPIEACALIADAAAELRETHGAYERAGVGFPGVADFRRGVARSSVMLDGWLDVPLAARLGELLGVPCVIDNDVNMAAIAELHARRDDVPESMLFVAVGTGIGGAITFGDRIWRGHTGVAGEIGNTTIDRHGVVCWCGRRGCLNTCASGTAIGEHQGDPHWTASGHDASRLQLSVHAAAVSLGIGVANALNLMNPSLVVLGGGVSRYGTPWLDVVASTARAEAFREAAQCRIELARAGYGASAVGAALLAMEGRGGPSATSRTRHPGAAAFAGARS